MTPVARSPRGVLPVKEDRFFSSALELDYMSVSIRLTLLEKHYTGESTFLQVPQVDRRATSFEVPLAGSRCQASRSQNLDVSYSPTYISRYVSNASFIATSSSLSDSEGTAPSASEGE